MSKIFLDMCRTTRTLNEHLKKICLLLLNGLNFRLKVYYSNVTRRPPINSDTVALLLSFKSIQYVEVSTEFTEHMLNGYGNETDLKCSGHFSLHHWTFQTGAPKFSSSDKKSLLTDRLNWVETYLYHFIRCSVLILQWVVLQTIVPSWKTSLGNQRKEFTMSR